MSDHRDTRAERLGDALDDFVRSSPDVEAAAVVSFDGLTMASALPEELEEDRLGAMSAALLSLGEQAAAGLGRGELNQVFIEGEHGFVFLMSARDQAVLAAVATRSAKIGFMLYEMRRAADAVGGVLEQAAAATAEPFAQAPQADAAPSAPAPDSPAGQALAEGTANVRPRGLPGFEHGLYPVDDQPDGGSAQTAEATPAPEATSAAGPAPAPDAAAAAEPPRAEAPAARSPLHEAAGLAPPPEPQSPGEETADALAALEAQAQWPASDAVELPDVSVSDDPTAPLWDRSSAGGR